MKRPLGWDMESASITRSEKGQEYKISEQKTAKAGEKYAVCPVCPHHCRLREGVVGRCRARGCENGHVVPVNYGMVTALALDPIEKKPLHFFHPGSRILSVGSFGCNLHCPFCQNHEIAEGTAKSTGAVRMSPEEILEAAVNLRSRGNIGVAFTYNEALVGYEFVRDTARLVHEAGMYNVLVTNGMAEIPILLELLPYIDAMNIDLKAFRPELYKWLGGDLQTVMRFISRAAEDAHVELTTLIIPGKNDDPRDMEEEAAWIAEIDPEIPLHITRYFPRHRMTEPPTDIRKMRELMSVAKKYLKNVCLGNV